jgi:hypothetical protein
MFITKSHLPRRTFLRGVGATIALPFLDSMVPAQTQLAKAAAAPRTRFAAIFSPHGWSPTYWADGRPDIAPMEGRNVGLGFIHKPLAPFQDNLTIFSGMDATASMPPPGSSGGDHSRACATFTGAPPKKTAGADIYCGTSIDQIVAQKYGQDTLLPSIQLAIEDPGANTGICGWGYSCAYSNSISWASATKPLPHEINPQVVFEHLYGDGSTPEERTARREASGSILDAVTQKVEKLKRVLPASDRARLNDYLEAVRELERRLQIAAKATSHVPDGEIPFGVPESFDDHIKLHYDLQALAFQGDITRVSSLMYARDVSLRSYPESGIQTPNHPSSHHGEDPKRREDWAKINQYHAKCLAYFLKKLQSIPDGDGSLLDHTLVVWGSNMGNANQHSHVNVGYLFAGGASGKHKPKMLNVKETGPTSNILLTAVQMMGIEKDAVGDSTKTVAIS